MGDPLILQHSQFKGCGILLPEDIASLLNTYNQNYQARNLKNRGDIYEDPNKHILPLIEEADQENQLYIYSASLSKYVQPHRVHNIDRNYLSVDIQPGERRLIDLDGVCSFNVAYDIIDQEQIPTCVDLYDDWNWQYEVRGDRIFVKSGENSNLVAIRVKPKAYDLWNDYAEGHELPITFTVVLPDGSYIYYYDGDFRNRDSIQRVKSHDIGPGIHFHGEGGRVEVPCVGTYEILEGLEGNKPILSLMPDWLQQIVRQR